MKSDTRRQSSRSTRGRLTENILRYAALSILTTSVVGTIVIAAPASSDMMVAYGDEAATYTPYYMTEEYQEMKRQEQIEAEREAETLKKEMEEYQEEQEKKAEAKLKMARVEFAEVPYPFNTMSQDWGAGDIEGFVYYEIPKEYSCEGGYFPEVMQVYLWCICRDMGVDYPTAIAMIEQETGYKYDCIGAANDTGYFQVIEEFHKERMKMLEVDDLLNPYQNALVAMDFMAELLDDYDGNYAKALTAYNCGKGGAYKYYFSAGVDANPHAKKVLKKAERISSELNAAEN